MINTLTSRWAGLRADRSRNRFGLSALVLGLVLAAAGCGAGAEKTTTDGGSKTSEKSGEAGKTAIDGKDLTVGIVFDSGGRGDKSFNDSAWAGIERAQKEFGIQVKSVDSKKESDYEDNIAGMATQGAGLVFAIGIGQNTALTAVAPQHPDTKFAIIDAVVEAPNVRSVVFSEEQGSFLAGYAAALASKTGKIGFVGGKNIPLIKKFEAGYTAGAKFARPDITVLPAKYTDSWEDAGKGKAAAALLFNEGADVVYQAAGRAGLGVIAAAKEAGKFAIGVDSDQDDIEKGVVLTSMIKRVDEAVYQTIKDTLEGNFAPGTKAYDLSANGVGLSDFRNTKSVLGEANLTRLQEVAQSIKDKKITVPSRTEDVEAFLKENPSK